MRPKHPTCIALASAGLLILAGCSRSSEDSATAESSEASTTVDAGGQSAAAPTARDQDTGPPSAIAVPPPTAVNESNAPGLTTGAAPGVAFAYRYAFSLPAKAISSVQQQHALACERLGSTRCQITGMSYDQPRQGEVAARLDLLLAPEIAQRFGSEGIAAVEQAEGRLANAAINGEDAGGAIEQSQRQSASLKAELSRIERRLIAKGLAAEERTELVRHAEELRAQLRGEQALRADKEASIATTPMSFAYASEGLFSAGNDPFGKAAESSFGSFQALGAFLLTFAGLALPWLLLVALIVLLFRFRAMKQRLVELSAPPPAADPVAPPQ